MSTIPLVTGIFPLLAYFAWALVQLYRQHQRTRQELLSRPDTPDQVKILEVLSHWFHVKTDDLPPRIRVKIILLQVWLRTAFYTLLAVLGFILLLILILRVSEVGLGANAQVQPPSRVPASSPTTTEECNVPFKDKSLNCRL